MTDAIKCQESYDAGYESGHTDGEAEGYHNGYGDGSDKCPFSNSQRDDLRFTVRAIKSGDGEQAIFSLCRALGDATEASEVVRNEWRRL